MNRWALSHRRKVRQGFTLIELLVVIAIIAVLLIGLLFARRAEGARSCRPVCRAATILKQIGPCGDEFRKAPTAACREVENCPLPGVPRTVGSLEQFTKPQDFQSPTHDDDFALYRAGECLQPAQFEVTAQRGGQF